MAITYIFIYHNTPKTYWKNVQGESENQLKTKEKPQKEAKKGCIQRGLGCTKMKSCRRRPNRRPLHLYIPDQSTERKEGLYLFGLGW
jgi:hypothetical protein